MLAVSLLRPFRDLIGAGHENAAATVVNSVQRDTSRLSRSVSGVRGSAEQCRPLQLTNLGLGRTVRERETVGGRLRYLGEYTKTFLSAGL